MEGTTYLSPFVWFELIIQQMMIALIRLFKHWCVLLSWVDCLSSYHWGHDMTFLHLNSRQVSQYNFT